jgi:hypothetical protein
MTDESISLQDNTTGEVDSLATTILLDGTLTLAAFLGIAFNPVCGLAVIMALL